MSVLPSPHDPSRTDQSRLVGREREQAVLGARLTAALAGQGSVVLISGEAGIGKTTLAESVARAAVDRGALTLIGRCYDLTDTPPYGAWVDLFSRFPRDCTGPSLPDLFAQPGIVGEIASQTALFQQVRDFLTALAERQPLLIVLDDMHWADAASLDLLRFLVRFLSQLTIMFIVIYRTDETDPERPFYRMVPALIREGRAGRIDLRALRDEAVHELIATRYDVPDADISRLVVYLQERAEGNPFFLGELLRTLEDAGTLDQTTGGWTLAALAPVRVPTLVRQVIGERLDRIGTDARQLLAVASVIGHDVPLSLWRAVTAVTDEDLFILVELAVKTHLLEPSPTGTHVHFIHALIRQALYESILPARRRMMHQQIGETMAAASPTDPDAVAFHFQHAGDERAIQWLIVAGERAERAYAWLTAADRFEAAVTLMDERGADARERGWLLVRVARLRRYANPQQGIAYLDSAAHLAAEAQDELLRALALFNRGLLSCFIGEIRRGLGEMEAGVMALKQISVADRARAAGMPNVFALQDPSHGEGTLVLWLAIAGRHVEARALGERMLGGTPTQLPRTMIVGRNQNDIFKGLGHAYTLLALPDEADRAYEMLATGLRNEENFVNLGMNAIDRLRCLLLYHADEREGRERLVMDAAAGWQLADDASHDDLQRYIRLPLLAVEGRWAELRQLPMVTFDALAWALRSALGPVLRQQGETALAWKLIHEVLPNGPRTAPGNVRFYVAVECQRLAAMLAIDAGNLPTARAWLEAHDRWLAWSGAVLGRAESALGWAAYHRATGDIVLARQFASEALIHATEPRQPLALLVAHRLLGELECAVGHAAEAAAHLAAARALADACAAPYESALTLLSQAELHQMKGEIAAAHAAIAEARTICEPLNAMRALARADSLAASLGDGAIAKRSPTPKHPDGLTHREQDILRMIAAGWSNREIAENLFVSIRTVERHITNLYRKIDANGKADATAYFFRHHRA